MTGTNEVSRRIARIIIAAVAMLVGILTLADIFVSQTSAALFGVPGLGQSIHNIATFLVSTTVIIVAFAFFLGFYNVVSIHWNRIQTQKPGGIYSIALLVSLAVTVTLGIGGPTSVNTQFIFEFVLQPLESTFFALLALFIATAAFRAFRVHSWETFFFVLFALIVLLGQIPISIYLWSELPVLKDWILNVPALAGVRGILMGVALGTIATGLRVLIGVERPYTN